MRLRREAELQYVTSDPLKVRMETHLRYSERQIDLDKECRHAMGLSGDESILEVGCGPGVFLTHLRDRGHRGRLVGLDLSEAMIAEAASNESKVEWVVGDVLELPFSDEEFDWIVARHMLYYVDDLHAALREISRVIGQDGTFLATTNAAATTPRIGQLCLDLLNAFGLPLVRHAAWKFHTETAVEALRTAWPHVTEILLDNAFVFTEPDPIVNYVATMPPSVDGITGPEMRDEMLGWLDREAANRLNAMDGVWRDPKVVGLYICR